MVEAAHIGLSDTLPVMFGNMVSFDLVAGTVGCLSIAGARLVDSSLENIGAEPATEGSRKLL